jgi:hypothetical protein
VEGVDDRRLGGDRVSLPGLTRDAVVISRPDTTVDAEGIPTPTYATIIDGAGTWGSPSYSDLARAEQAGQQVDAVLAMPTPTVEVRPGDRVTVRGDAYDVVSVADARTHTRLFLRRSE